ncbi:MAG: ABC transporter ATP-binding protein [Pseudomonadota bacterium]
MAERLIEVEDLAVEFHTAQGTVHAVNGIGYHLDASETLAILGESGSGKSVQAAAIMNLIDSPPGYITGGRVLYRDTDLLTLSNEARREINGQRIAMIFQDTLAHLNPVYSVGWQIAETLTVHGETGQTEARERAVALLERVGIPDPKRRFEDYPHQFSGGQRQRIMIAMALALRPEVLIADEPTTALDVTTQAQILRLIKELQSERDTGVLFITHDFGVVAEIADRVAVMQTGRIVEMGDAKQVLSDPQHAYTQMLISAVPSMTPKHRAAVDGAQVALATHALSKTYRSGGMFGGGRVVHAAKDVDLSIRRGETLGIVGESGSGKSTVARCIVRLIAPSGGQIVIDGHDIATAPARLLREHRRRVQIVFQDPYRSLNPRRKVGQSIIEGPTNFGVAYDEAWQRARDLMTLVGLDPKALERYPHQFSGGQRQRICIARALAMQPEVLIADEAVSALDVSVQAQVLDLLDQVRRRFDLAMLFITHDLRVAAQVCDQVAVMFQGEVVEHGTAVDVFGDPKHEYTRALFDAAPGRDWEFGGAEAP